MTDQDPQFKVADRERMERIERALLWLLDDKIMRRNWVVGGEHEASLDTARFIMNKYPHPSKKYVIGGGS